MNLRCFVQSPQKQLSIIISLSGSSVSVQDLLNQMWMSPTLDTNFMTSGLRFSDAVPHGAPCTPLLL